MVDLCPLCQSQARSHIGAIPTAPIHDYWRRFGYDIKRFHDPIPEKLEKYSCLNCALIRYHPVMIGADKLYQTESDHIDYYETNKWEFISVLSYIKKQKFQNLLDYGCGDGNFIKLVSSFIKNTQGFDFNQEAIKQAQLSGSGNFTSNQDQITGLFDCITCFQVLEHLDDPRSAILFMVEKLKPGGILILAVPNQDGLLGVVQGNILNQPPHHATLWPEATLAFIAEIAALELREQYFEPPNFLLYSQALVARTEEAMKGLRAGRWLLRPFRWLTLLYAAWRFDEVRATFKGHTQIALFAKKELKAENNKTSLKE